MEYFDKQRIIDSILWGKIPTHNPALIFDVPSAEDRGMASLIYKQLTQSYGFLSTEESLDFFGWTIDHEAEILVLRKDVEKIKRGLLDYYPLYKSKLRKARQILRATEKTLLQKITSKYECLIYTAEHYALIESQKYMIGRITKTIDGQKYWATDKDFYNEVDLTFINMLRNMYFDETNYSEAIFRELARSEPWRSFWGLFKTTDRLLNSDHQRRLIYWSQVYDAVYESCERPATEVINDDDLIDSWFIRQADQMEKHSKEKAIDEKVKPGKPGGRQEQFIFSDKEGSQEIYDMNDPLRKARIRSQQEIIKKKGRVEDQDLPVSQEQLRQQLMDKRSQQRKTISSRR